MPVLHYRAIRFLDFDVYFMRSLWSEGFLLKSMGISECLWISEDLLYFRMGFFLYLSMMTAKVLSPTSAPSSTCTRMA